jgi:hypothetical protein
VLPPYQERDPITAKRTTHLDMGRENFDIKSNYRNRDWQKIQKYRNMTSISCLSLSSHSFPYKHEIITKPLSIQSKKHTKQQEADVQNKLVENK